MRNWWGESSRILPVWTKVVVVVAAADEPAGSAVDDSASEALVASANSAWL
jgi:hypothetical protein